MTDIDYLQAVLKKCKANAEPDSDLEVEIDGAIDFLESLSDAPQIILTH